MAKEIPLTQGQVAIVDDEDFERLNQHKWYAAWCEYTQTFYAQRGVRRNGKTIIYRMHEDVLEAPAGMLVDHRKAEETLNNQKSNLRTASRLQNAQNRRVRRKSISGLKGVCYHGPGKWTALIMFEGKQRYLGYFSEKIEAGRAYDRAAIKYHGEFARLNFPREDYIDGQ